MMGSGLPPQVLLNRWVKNARVANRALLVLGNVNEYVDTITRQPKVSTVPNNKSFDTVKEGCKWALMPAKLMFFEYVARQFEEFHIRYHTGMADGAPETQEGCDKARQADPLASATAKPTTSTARMTNKRVIIGRATDLSIKAAM